MIRKPLPSSVLGGTQGLFLFCFLLSTSACWFQILHDTVMGSAPLMLAVIQHLFQGFPWLSCHPSTGKPEGGQPGLHNMTLRKEKWEKKK